MTAGRDSRPPRAPEGHCDGFSRAQAIRRVLAGGKPVAREWDARMPIPAGAGIDRRRFLAGAIGGIVTVYGAERLGLTDRMLGKEMISGEVATQADGTRLAYNGRSAAIENRQ